MASKQVQFVDAKTNRQMVVTVPQFPKVGDDFTTEGEAFTVTHVTMLLSPWGTFEKAVAQVVPKLIIVEEGK